MDRINQYLFFKPFLKKMSEGGFFKNVFAWFLRIIAAFEVLGLLLISLKMWQLLSTNFDVKAFIVMLLSQVLIIALVYLIITILLSRADDIAALPLKNDYIVIPIFVLVTKMIGEILAVFYTIMGLVTAIAIWIMGSMPNIVPGTSMLCGNNGVIGGFISLVSGPLFGFVLLSIFYFIAEQLGVFVDIARNTKR
jgi:hypothetical protein